jgi:hypothetical protein
MVYPSSFSVAAVVCAAVVVLGGYLHTIAPTVVGGDTGELLAEVIYFASRLSPQL